MRVFLLLLLCTLSLSAVDVDLRNPTFAEGVLSTEEGGVISAPHVRIQARKMRYEKANRPEGLIERIVAEGDLIVEFGENLFVGERLEYDFLTQEGVLFEGVTEVEPWFIGGKEIFLKSDGSYLIYKGFATTSESVDADWKIEVEQAKLSRSQIFSAKNVNFRLFHLSLFWVPRFKINLDAIFNSPIRYTVRFGGYERTRLGISYDAFIWGNWKTRLNLDYRFARGPGFGIDFDYKSATGQAVFHATNYAARDVTLYNGKKRTRYRYSGDYENYMESSKVTILGSYDVLSDKEVATDYSDQGLALFSGERTQFEIHKESKNWLLHLLTRVRVNDFQTVKEELPTFSGSLRPFEIGRTGVISQNECSFSYLRLQVSEDRKDAEDFHTPRCELSHNFYRPFCWRPLTVTPEAGFLAVYYGNNAEKFDRWLTMGLFQLSAQMDWYKDYRSTKHVLTPYAQYRYYTYPETPPRQHFIFDLEDGWYKVDHLRMGIRNTLFEKQCDVVIEERFFSDIYVYSFFNTHTLRYEIPKAYAHFEFQPTPFMSHSLSSAWDLQRGMLDHWNSAVAWTISEKTAFRAEYRHRSPFCWRKVDADNFVLDSFREADFLRHTEVSDRRDTLLLNLYHRFHPNWAIQLESRHGWKRESQPDYNEFQIDLLGTFRSSLHLKISYRHKEEEKDRITFNISIGLQKPKDGIK